jgi:hypothetical protein
LVPVNLTSIDVDEYRAGLNCGPRGDDGEDLGTVDIFGAFGAMDGDDGVGMATPSSTMSMAMPIAIVSIILYDCMFLISFWTEFCMLSVSIKSV